MMIGSTVFGVMLLVAAGLLARTGFAPTQSTEDRLSLVCYALAGSAFGVYMLAGGEAAAAPILSQIGFFFLFAGVGLSILGVARALLRRASARRR
jgi:hypothetical protein